MFFPGSRYNGLTTYSVTLPDGSVVMATTLPKPGSTAVLGFYRRAEGQRLDHIANFYLSDAIGFWRLCDANGTIVPDALAHRSLIGIPAGAQARGS